MRLPLLLSGILLGLLADQGAGNKCPQKKSVTLVPSFTVTTMATERSTTSPETTTGHGKTATSHRTSTAATIPHSNSTTTSYPTTSEGTAITHGTTTSPRNTSTISPSKSVPVPPSPEPTSGPSGTVGDYTGANGSQLCVRLRAQIQMRVLYQSHSGGKLWGIFVLNPNRTVAQGSCDGNHSSLILSFPDGKLIFDFKQDSIKKTVYLNCLVTEFNVSFPSATRWTFSAENSSLHDLQAPLGHSFSCRNRSITLSPDVHLDLLSLQLQAAQLPPTGAFGTAFSCSAELNILVPLVVGLIVLALLTLVLSAFCISRRRPPAYQPL
ncbi:macrosialin isoform X1 [Vombatus ursinus]|uniref:Macrosialin n=1 Tax=Vombatus ursinus TaxID=29139 RepID=A0A4X2K403_VOMUR|nr:macrosialin isoform X1 [Vombatus ursinus]